MLEKFSFLTAIVSGNILIENEVKRLFNRIPSFVVCSQNLMGKKVIVLNR